MEKIEPSLTTPDVFGRWADRAVRKLRFPPDRRRVRAELYEHFLDRREALLYRGLREAEADSLAVEMMGDPSETAELLSKVHKPWLGWLLRLTRIVLICVVLLVFHHYKDSFSSALFSRVSPEEFLEDSYYEHWEGQTGCDVIAMRKAATNDHVAFGPFDVTLEDGGIYYIQENVEYEGGRRSIKTTWCRLVLSFSAAPWHKVTGDMVERNLHIVTDTGESYALALSPYEESDVKPKIYNLSISGRLRLNAWACFFEMDIPKDAHWLELWFTRSGEENRIRIDLADWAFDPDYAMETMTDETAAAETLVQKQLGLGTWGIEKPVIQARTPLPVTGTTAEGGVSIPWAVETLYGDGSGGAETDPQSFTECVLVFPSADCEPLLWEDLSARLRVTTADPGAEASELEYLPGGRDLYQNAIVWLIRWPSESGSSGFVITDTGGRHGVPAVLTIKVGEEAAP